MALFGNVPRFDHRHSDWPIFLNTLESFFIANDVTAEKADKKKAILITALTEESHKLLRNLVHPVDISTATYEQLIEALNKNFKPMQSCFMERFKFYSAFKNQKETIHQWAARVRSLGSNCDFDSYLPIALRDKFIMGIEKGPIKDKLLAEDAKTLTFEKAIEIALNLECIKAQFDGSRQQQQQQQQNFNPQQKQTKQPKFNRGGKRSDNLEVSTSKNRPK